MVADAIKLMLFPALMAFAASSDLLTMTISNRVSLILAGGFFALAVFTGMSGTEILLHLGAGGVVLLLAFGTLCPGLDRRRRREARGGHRAMARLRPSSALRHLCVGFRRRIDHCVASVPAGAIAGLARERTLGAAAASQGRRRAVWHRAGRGRPRNLPGYAVDGVRHVSAFGPPPCAGPTLESETPLPMNVMRCVASTGERATNH